MPGTHGNDNLAFARKNQFLTIDGSSDTVTLPVGLQAVTLFSDVACWINIGDPGKAPVAAAPGAEKTEAAGFFLPATTVLDVPVPATKDDALLKIAGIQADGAGTLYVTYREFG